MNHPAHHSAKLSALLRGAVAALPLMLATFPAIAYVGPGAGLSVLSALWGLLVAVAVALGFVLLWPLRRLLRTRRNNRQVTPEKGQAASGGRSGSGS